MMLQNFYSNVAEKKERKAMLDASAAAVASKFRSVQKKPDYQETYIYLLAPCTRLYNLVQSCTRSKMSKVHKVFKNRRSMLVKGSV